MSGGYGGFSSARTVAVNSAPDRRCYAEQNQISLNRPFFAVQPQVLFPQLRTDRFSLLKLRLGCARRNAGNSPGSIPQRKRADERRVGNEWVSTGRSRRAPDHQKNKKNKNSIKS